MSIDLRERKKLKRRTISLMDDWVFKAVIGDPEDEVCLSSFLTTKQFVMISAV